MFCKTIIAASILAWLVIANPVPANVNQPITDSEWDNLYSGGLQRRHGAKVNQPITDAEYQALSDGGFNRRNASDETISSLVVRDKTMNCGHLVTGKSGSGGHGKWVPVQQFADLAEQFCESFFRGRGALPQRQFLNCWTQ